MLLIDPPAWPAHGRLWSHLVSDTSVEELHEFAARAGIPRRGFEGDHYDVPQERYDAVVAAGAHPTHPRDLVRRLRDSGLRIPKRKHERVIAATYDPACLPAGSRADVIASQQDSAPPHTVVVRLAIHGPDGLWVTQRADGAGADLPTRAVAPGQTPIEALVALMDDCGIARPVAGSGGPTLLGYVRNTVPHPDDDYPWLVPTASFVVWALSAPAPDPGSTTVPGTWCPPSRVAEELGARHWWPLVDLLDLS